MCCITAGDIENLILNFKKFKNGACINSIISANLKNCWIDGREMIQNKDSLEVKKVEEFEKKSVFINKNRLARVPASDMIPLIYCFPPKNGKNEIFVVTGNRCGNGDSNGKRNSRVSFFIHRCEV